MLKQVILITLVIITFSHSKESMKHIKKSPNDNKSYQYITLDNGIKLLAISDKNTPRAAAAVDLTVGSSSDPDGFLGLAHFLEHMLFLGTDKYPDSDDYINFINHHGGNHNAYTSFENTNYFFDVDPNFLHEGLKRFSRFFVAPLLSEEYVERERNAVDSEYQSKLQEDGWRNLEVMKTVINPNHPYSRFTIGNNDTLPSQTVRKALVNFYENFYTPDRMSVVILGKESTEQLIEWGKTLFSAVPNRARVDNTIQEKLLDKSSLPMQLSNPTIKDEKSLSIFYHFDYQPDLDYKKTLHYISHILGYEGKGSLLSILKQLNYAHSLYSGSGYRIGNEVSFEIGLELTDKGYQNQSDILAIIFSYIDKMKVDKEGERRYLELAQIASNQFTYQEKKTAIRLVSDYAVRVNRYPIEDILSIFSIYQGYDQDSVNQFLEKMTINHALIHVSAPDIQGEQKTTYFDVPYSKTPLDISVINQLSEEAKQQLDYSHLPRKNPFLADDYALKEPSTPCQQKQLGNQIELYHCLNTQFGVPKSLVLLALQPSQELSIKDKTQLNLLSRVIAENIDQTVYDASIANLSVELAAGEKSLILSLEGYQQKIPELLGFVLKAMRASDVDETVFNRVKETYKQELMNAEKESPYSQTFALLNKQLVEDASLPKERLSVLDDISSQQLYDFSRKIFNQIAIKLFVYGNSTLDEAESIGGLVANTLTDSQIENTWKNNRAKAINSSLEQEFDAHHKDSAITYYLPAGEGYAERAKIGLLAKVIEPKFFNDLRTEKQLGYVVFAYPKPNYNQAGLAFTVQSPVANAEALQGYIEAFNQKMAKEIDTLDQATFDELKTVLIAEILQAPHKLSTAASHIWSDIIKTGSMESSREIIAKEVEKLSLKALQDKAKAVLTQPLHISIKTKTGQ